MPVPATPSIAERFAIALEHAAMVEAYEADPEGAAIEFRKHLGWYVKGLPNSAELRRRLHAVNSFSEVEGIFADYLRWIEERTLDAAPLDHDDSAELEPAEA
jgi:tRNA-dihydrouridine synthase